MNGQILMVVPFKKLKVGTIWKKQYQSASPTNQACIEQLLLILHQCNQRTTPLLALRSSHILRCKLVYQFLCQLFGPMSMCLQKLGRQPSLYRDRMNRLVYKFLQLFLIHSFLKQKVDLLLSKK